MMNYKISPKTIDLLIRFEGFKSFPYLDSGKKATIGFGSTFYKDGTPVTILDKPISQKDAIDLLGHQLEKIESAINRLVTNMSLNPNQVDALASFIYNIGIHAFEESTMLKRINSGNLASAGQQFPLWNKVHGVVNIGLSKRRAAEQTLFYTPYNQ